MTSEGAAVIDEARHVTEHGGATERLLERLIDRVGGRSGVQAVFGDPIERGELTVVPVARLRWFFAAGGGGGQLGGAELEATGTRSAGAGGAAAVPVGYLEIGPSGARYEPIDQLPSPWFLLAAGLTSALVLAGVRRLLRG